jgi:hypothetical protein
MDGLKDACCKEFLKVVRAASMASASASRGLMQDVRVELELRLGRRSNDGNAFVSGLEERHFQKILACLESYGGWTRVIDWSNFDDIFFDIELEGARVEVRSRVTYNGAIHVESITKKRVMDKVLDLRVAGLCVRPAVALEKVIENQCLPASVVPKHVRMRRRKSFVVGSTALSGDVFRFDVTLTWVAETKYEAEKAMRSEPPIMEVELECLRTNEYVQQTSATRLAESMFAKIADFLEELAE